MENHQTKSSFQFVCFALLFGETRSRWSEYLKRKCAAFAMEDIQGESNTVVLLVSSTVLEKKRGRILTSSVLASLLFP